MITIDRSLKTLFIACAAVFGSLMISVAAEGNQNKNFKDYTAEPKRGIASVSPAEQIAPSDQGQGLSMLRMKSAPDTSVQVDSAHKAPLAFGGICRSANGLRYSTTTQFQEKGYEDCVAAPQASSPNGYFGPAQRQAGAAIFFQ